MSRHGALLGELLELLPRACGPHGQVAAEAIRARLAPLTGLALAQLDLEIRERLSYDSHVPPGGLEGVVEPFVLGLISMHRDGHLREAALAALDGDPRAPLAFLIIRLNDWVDPVRRRAAAACERRLTPERADDWVSVLPLLQRLRHLRRRDHSPFVTWAVRLIEHPDSGPALERGTRAADPEVRRHCYRLLLSRGHAVAAALAEPDTVVRLFAMDRLLADAGPFELLERAAGDSFAGMRAPALDALARHFPDRARMHLRSSTLDRSVRVREIARTWLAKLDPSYDVLAVYREGGATVPAILGLSEVGSAAEAVRILPYRDHLQTSVRAAVVRALARLDRAAHGELIVAALSDPSPPVSREARKALSKRLPAAWAGDVWGIAADPRAPAHARRNALGTLMGLGKWARLTYILRALILDDPLTSLAHKLLENWQGQYNRSMAAPTRTDLAALDDLLASTGLPAEVARQLRFDLSVWRPR